MGAGNSNQNRTFYKLKVDKETNIPLFTKQKKDSNGAWVTDQTFNYVSGFLRKIELSSYEWEGDKIDTLKFMFDDDENSDATFQVETGLNYLSRNILNTLAGATNIAHVKITVYKSKGKDGRDGFPSAYLEINKQKAGWKYKPEEIPKAKEVKVGGKTLKDTTELDEFFKLLIPEINSKIVSEFEVTESMNEEKPNVYDPKRTATGNTNVVDEAPAPIDDLAFASPFYRIMPFFLRRNGLKFRQVHCDSQNEKCC